MKAPMVLRGEWRLSLLLAPQTAIVIAGGIVLSQAEVSAIIGGIFSTVNVFLLVGLSNVFRPRTRRRKRKNVGPKERPGPEEKPPVPPLRAVDLERDNDVSSGGGTDNLDL